MKSIVFAAKHKSHSENSNVPIGVELTEKVLRIVAGLNSNSFSDPNLQKIRCCARELDKILNRYQTALTGSVLYSYITLRAATSAKMLQSTKKI